MPEICTKHAGNTESPHMKSFKDIVFIVGLIVIVWLAVKVLFWTLQNVFLLAVLALIVYLLFRLGIFSRFFKK
jgi:hypothetical protein